MEENIDCNFFAQQFFQTTEQIVTPWKFGSTLKSKYESCGSIDTFDRYLFQLIVLLKSDFNCFINVILSWVGKITTEIYSFVSVIANVAP